MVEQEVERNGQQYHSRPNRGPAQRELVSFTVWNVCEVHPICFEVSRIASVFMTFANRVPNL